MRTTVSLYCTCGAAWKISAPVAMTEALVQSWNEEHQGEGHAPATAKIAATARYRAELEVGKLIADDR